MQAKEAKSDCRNKEALHVALAGLLRPDEHYLDYLATTTGQKAPASREDEAALSERLQGAAKVAVSLAQRNLVAEDIPFRKPDDFTAEMFRPEFLQKRLLRIQEKKQEELRMQQAVRRRRMERQQQVALQHGKRMGKHQQLKMQKEIIERWKEERATARGSDESKLPTLEQIEAKYAKEHKTKRAQKNARYGGKLTKQKAKRQLGRARRQKE